MKASGSPRGVFCMTYLIFRPNVFPSPNNLLKELTSKYGHCVFANTKKYRKCGGENENFIGYGPEDQERENRFITLKYNVSRVDNLVYHFEHSRTPFSNGDNKYYDPNHKLCVELLDI
jgi:predicted glycosyltransferase involved in capsule biosynthesis